MKTDKYQEAVEYLTANPDQIRTAWNIQANHSCHHLFRKISPSPSIKDDNCGCLTLIRMANKAGLQFRAMALNSSYLPNEELTASIANDSRLPELCGEIQPLHLLIFAEWQRRIDYYYSTGILDMERDFTVPNSQFPDVKPEPAKEQPKEVYIYSYPPRCEAVEKLISEYEPSSN